MSATYYLNTTPSAANFAESYWVMWRVLDDWFPFLRDNGFENYYKKIFRQENAENGSQVDSHKITLIYFLQINGESFPRLSIGGDLLQICARKILEGLWVLGMPFGLA